MMKDQCQHKREIKSYVRRESRMSQTQRTALATLWPHYGLSIDSGVIDYQQIFATHQGVIIEIGFGMGQSLLTMAKAAPHLGFIGIEVHRPGIANLLAGAESENINNIRVYCEDAINVLKQAIPDNSVTRIQLFFPDPWPKRRHHKRRLVQPEFLALVYDKLVIDGIFHAATDWQDYAKHMLQVLEATPGFVNQAGKQQFSPKPECRPKTKFETRGQRLGHAVWDILFKKVQITPGNH